MFRQYLPNISK